MNTVTRKIGRNRGKPRLWIEGKVLDEVGLHHGTRWTLTTLSGLLAIVVDHEEGKRKVSGKPDRPVIDIAGASLGDLGECAEVELTLHRHAGVIHVRPLKGN